MPKGIRPTRPPNPRPTSLSPSQEITDTDNEHSLVCILVRMPVTVNIREWDA